MRKVIIDTLMSLDGYYTNSKNNVDWFLGFEDDDLAWSHEVLTRVGLLVFGRTTYEEFSKIFPTLDAKATGWDPFIPDSLNRLPKVVFSKSLKEGSWEPVTIVREDPAKEIARLKEGSGKDINIVGSGSIVSAAVDAGLVDEYYLRIQPIILGSGKRLYRESGEPRGLTLVESRRLQTGVLALHYVPRR
jgi:dihydrofolate reductase